MISTTTTIDKPIAQKRYYGIDLLKTSAMLMIVTLHVLGHGGILAASKSATNLFFANLLETLAFCGVNCFALATGFLMCERKIKFTKIIPLWLTVFFYVSISTVITFFFFKSEPFYDIYNIFPVTSKCYWYFTSYFLLFVFMPFLNIFIDSLSENQFKKFLVAGFVLLCVLNSTFYNIDIFKVANGYSAWWLIYLYFLGSGLKKYDFFKKIKAPFALIGFFLTALVSCICYLTTHLKSFLSYSSALILIQSVLFMLFCLRVKIPKLLHKPLAILSPFIFQVYIIHENPIVRELLIRNRFASFATINPILMVLLVILISVAIFAVCILIDQVRYRLFKLLKVTELTDWITKLVTKKIKQIKK